MPSQSYRRLPSLVDDLEEITPYRPLRPGELTDLGEEQEDPVLAAASSSCRVCCRLDGQRVARGNVVIGTDGLCRMCRECGRG